MNIDVGLLGDYNLTPNQYVLIYLAYKRRYQEFNKIDRLLGYQTEKELEDAEKKGFIKMPNKDDSSPEIPANIKIRNKFLFALGEGEDYFDEILNEYPVKVVRPDGVKDYLRTDLKRCRRNYSKIATSRKKHRRILNALKYEKKVREQEDSWKYMKRLPKWLSSEEWKVFEERLKDEQDDRGEDKLGYGQELK